MAPMRLPRTWTHLLRRQVVDARPPQKNLTLTDASGRLEQTNDGGAGQRLTGTGLAHQAKNFPRFNAEADLIQGLEHRTSLRKLDTEVADFEQCHGVSSLQPGIERIAQPIPE